MTKRRLRFGMLAIGLVASVLYAMFYVPRGAQETGIPRYDILRDLAKLKGKVITGYFVEGGLRISNQGQISGWNPIRTHEILTRLRESRTTDPYLVSQGQEMRVSFTASCIGITYLEGGTVKRVRFSTWPGNEEALFGKSCGKLVKELWKEVTD